MLIFISCSDQDYEFAIRLYEDLENAGLTPWLHKKNVLAGQSIESEISRIIKKECSYFIAVLSSHSISKKGAFQKQLRTALDVQDEYPNGETFIIPILRTSEPLDERLEKLQYVDFTGPYKNGLKQILRVLKPDFLIDIKTLPGTDQEPSKSERLFFDKLFNMFHLYKYILLFAQEHREIIRTQRNLIAQAKDFFGAENVFHIVPPHQEIMTKETFFSIVGAQCKSPDKITDSIGFMNLIEHKLHDLKHILLLITRFEQGNEPGCVSLARTLAGLYEQYGPSLNILVSGGEKLARMYYQEIDLSLLRKAGVIEWPELTVDDVRVWCAEQWFSHEIAEQLFQIAGGNPRLLQEGFEFCRNGKTLDIDKCFKNLQFSHYLHASFSFYIKDENGRQRLWNLLQKEDVGPYMPHSEDPLLRHLYWKNLLKRSEDGQRLVWRCKVIREAGKQALRC